ncbi:MAG: phosphoribosylformylglycinamidine synthase subunit PurQ, partial [Rhodothermales bacterium]
SGAIARFSPVMNAVTSFAEQGGPVIGICNGFQTLCECGLLPGALLRNASIRFVCKPVGIRVERADTMFTNACSVGDVLSLPIAHGEGNYHADATTLDRLEANGQVLFRYCDTNGQPTSEANPNGSSRNIAGIINERGNVMGMMPHPERHVEALLGSNDGLAIFQSMVNAFVAA